jgi:uncharacterized protein (TIGR03437 family)
MTLSGSQSGATTTSSGDYSFTVAAGGNYTVTPSLAGYTFAPPSQTYTNLNGSQTDNFSATAVAQPTTIVSTFGPNDTTSTVDNDGIGSPSPSNNIQDEFASSFTPSASYTLDSITIAVENLSGTNQLTVYLASGVSQPGSPIESFSLAGIPSVYPGTIETVTSSLHPTLFAGTRYWVVVSAADLTNTYDAWALGLVPIPGELYEQHEFASSTAWFAPPGSPTGAPPGDATGAFSVAGYQVANYTISGQVSLLGAGLNGVAMTLSGSQSGATTTSSGNYSFTVAAGGNYTVTPSLAGYTFAPPSQTYTNLNGSQTDNFSATAVVTNYTISGQVSLLGAGLNGVAITLSGSQSGATTTSSGNYSFTVAAGGNYTVTPSLVGYTFAPPSQNYINLNGNQTANFSAVSGLSINPGGVVNDASYTAPVAAGSIAAAFGDFLLAAPVTDNSSPLVTSLSGLSLQFGTGPLAPLFYASAGQINFQIPWELAGQSQTTLTAALNGASSAAQTVSLAPFAPAIFTTNGQGTGPGAILDSNYHLVSSTNPTTAGATILIYCTGLGPVTNQPPTGSPGPSGPLARTIMTPTVTIGGALANVPFSGLAPGYVGLYQVNAQVPAGSASGDSVPIAISIGGVDSQTGVTVAVAPGVSSTGLSVTSLSTATPLPLTPLYIATSGVNPSAPLIVQFSNAAGFAFSESPIRIGSDGTVVAAVPLYVTPGTGMIGPGSVLLSLTQNDITTPPVAVSIQDLPSVSAYGVQPGQISHAVLDANAMILSRRLNEFQALQLLAGNAIDTSKAQAAVKSLLTAMLQAQIDIDQVASNPSLAIPAAVAKDGSLSSFDASSLDLMDRVTAVFLTQTFGTLLSQAPQTSPSSRPLLFEAYRPADSGSSVLNVLATLTSLEKVNVVTGLADTFVTLTKNALEGNPTTLLQLMDQSTATVGGATSLIGTVAQNPLVGAWGAAISNVYLVTNDIVDVVAFAGAASTNNQALWNAAIDEMQQNTKANMVALASLTAAYPPIAGTNLALGVSAVATLINVGSNIDTIMGPQTDAGTSVIGNSQLTPNIITADLLGGDGHVDLSGDDYVRQAGITFQLGGTTTLNSLTDVNGDYSLIFPIGVAGVNYSNTQAQVVDPISGQTLGTYSVNLSNATVDSQFPQVTANYPSEPSGYSESWCQKLLWASNLFIHDDIIAIEDSESTDPYLASLISPEQAFADLAGDLADRTSLLSSSGCWVELDSISQNPPKWP